MSTTRRRGRDRNSGITRRVDTLPCSQSQLELMQYHDGELAPPAAQKLERRLAWNPSERRYLERLEAIGDGVRDVARRTSPSREALELTDQIMARVAAEQSTLGPLASTRRPRSSASSPMTWRRKITVALGVGLGSTAALAAGALFWLSVGMPSETEAGVTATPLALERPSATDDDGRLGAAIESVDFGMGGGSIFMVQAGHAPTPVVWLTEPPEVEVGSEPL